MPLQCRFYEAVSNRRAFLACLVTWLVVSLPLYVVTYPPLWDYPAHLARIYILAQWETSPAFQSWYELRSFLLPNVGMDVIALGLAKIVPVAVAGRLFLAIVLALILSGCMVFHRGVYGHFSLSPLIAALFLFNWIWLFGFLNYLLGVGVMLWAAGLWLMMSRKTPWLRLLCGTISSVVLFFCHLVALGLYAIFVAGYEVQRGAAAVRGNMWAALRDLSVSAAIFLIPGLLFLSSPTSGEALQISYGNPVWKPLIVYRTLQSGNLILDHVTFAVIALGLMLALWSNSLHLARSMYLPLAMLLAAYLVAPSWLLSARFVDVRLPVAILFVTVGSLSLRQRSQACHRAVLVGLAVLLVCRSIVLSYDWYQYDRVIHALVAALARLPRHSILFVATEAPSNVSDMKKGFDRRFWQPPLNHVAAWATLQQSAFVPTIFAYPGQQPIVVASRYAPLYNFQGGDPISVKSGEELDEVTKRIGRLILSTGQQAASVFLLVLYPELLHLSPPRHTDVVSMGPHFLILKLTGGQD